MATRRPKSGASSSFQLSPLNDRALALALDAYRAAALFYAHVNIEHSVNYDEFRRLDEFDPVSCARETESYFADQLFAEAKAVLGAAGLGERPPKYIHLDECIGRKDFKKNRRAMAVLGLLETARDAMRNLPAERFTTAMQRAYKTGMT